MSSRHPSLSRTGYRLLEDLVTLVRRALTSRAHLAAENLFLRKQLALYQERRTRPRRPDPATRVTLVLLSRWLDWRSMLTWYNLTRSSGGTARSGGYSGSGNRGLAVRRFRPTCSRLIVTMARANPTWGEERIANELLLKLGLTVSPRTVGWCLRRLRPSRGGRSSQRSATFVRNHADAILASDFFIAVTARFRILYVFVVLDIGTRRIIHWNVTEHPTPGPLAADDPADASRLPAARSDPGHLFRGAVAA